MGMSYISFLDPLPNYLKRIRIKFDTLSQLVSLRAMSSVTYSLGAVTNIVVSLVMIYLLQTSKTGFKNTTNLINRLVSPVLL
jgi:hypothetical protein